MHVPLHSLSFLFSTDKLIFTAQVSALGTYVCAEKRILTT
jgi:hypothetical protein